MRYWFCSVLHNFIRCRLRWLGLAVLAALVFVLRADVSIWAVPGIGLPDDSTETFWTLQLEPPPSDTIVPELPTLYLLNEPLGPIATASPTPTPGRAGGLPQQQQPIRKLRQHKDVEEPNPWALNLHLGQMGSRDSLDLETYRAFRQRDGVVRTWNDSVVTLLSRTDREKQGNLKIGLALPSAVASIVGEGGAGLKVSGYQRIAFAGRSSWTEGASTATVKQNKFPSLKMEQINRFSVEGTVGSKITVSVDQDSRRTTDLENRIIVRYKSDEDDIVQSIDLGNTTIALSDARFIGYSERIQGLFGIGMAGKVGAVDWKAIASQEKGNTARSRLTAGANESEIIIRDYQFDRYRFFDVGKIGGTNHMGPGDSIFAFFLYQSVGTLDPNEPEAVAYPNYLNSTASPDSVSQRFRQLDYGYDYELISDVNNGRYYVYFPTRLQNIQTTTIAYHMVVRKADGSELVFGDLTGEKFRLQMLKKSNPQPTDPLWDAEWKNVYDLRVRNIDYLELQLDLFRGELGDEENRANLNHQNGTYYLRLLGLDQVNAAGQPTPDNKVDDNPAILDTTRGLLIFPNRYPFADSTLLTEYIPTLYTSANPNDLRDSSKYYLKLKSRQRSRSVRLNTINLLENSEVVTMNGRRLSRGVHYNIDYSTGEVEFLDDDVLDPNATVTIDYEYSPFITAEKRTLLGFSTKYEPSQTFRTGGTVLYKGTKATDRPAQLGAEPYRDFVGEYFLNWSTNPMFLTKIADAIPLIKTTAPSNITFQGAIARSMPNPNTRGSVYVDDFEGTKRAASLGVVRETWSIASPPYDLANTGELLPTRELYDRAFIWFNPYTQFQDIDIWERDENRQNSADRRTHVLVLEARPQNSATRAPEEPNTAAWGGIMRGLPLSQWDQSRAEYIELRMAVVNRGAMAGNLHIDLGRISEDVNDNGELNTEDRPESGLTSGNKLLDDGEDVGLDGLPDSLEVSTDGRPYHPVDNPDPAGDNWDYDNDSETRNFYDHINGTENSLRDPVRGLRPDTEDLGGESEFDRVNAYYQFSINLDDPVDEALVQNTEKTSGDVTGFANSLTWKTYRIPLWDSKYYDQFMDPGVTPDSNQIQYARIWLSGADSTTRIYIAAADIVERTWKASLISSDSTGVQPEPDFQLGVKNTEENLDYTSPPGVSGYRDPSTNYREKEQSILLTYKNFRAGDEGNASIKVTKEDFTGYRNLEMWIYADSAAQDGKTMVYVRFGQNADNYYEYRDTLTYLPDPIENWRANAMKVDFNQITALKDTTSVGQVGFSEYVYDPVYKTGVFGQPSLANISYREIGVIRLGDASDPPVSGEVLGDELRLEEVRKDPGTAASGRVTVQMADLIGGTVGVEALTYSFRGLNQGRSSSVQAGSDQMKYSANGNIKLDKFLPENLGITFPISVTYNKDVATPRLLTGSDIVLTESRQETERSTMINEGVSLPLSIRPKKSGWLVNATLAAITTRFSVTRSRSWTPTTPYSEATGYIASADYRLKFSERLTFRPFGWTRYLLIPQRLHATPFSILPNDVRAQGTIQRRKSTVTNNLGDQTDAYSRTFNGSAGLNLSPIPAVSVKFDMTTNRDMSLAQDVELSLNPREFKFGRELAYSQNASASYRPNLVSFLTPTFSYSTVFSDKIDRTFDDHDVSGNRNWSISGTLDPAKFWGFLGARPKGSKAGAANKLRVDDKGVRERRRDVDTTAADSTQKAAPPKPSGGGGAAPLDAWRALMGGFRWITSPIGQTTLNYGRTDSDSRRDLDNRPTWRYRFGIDLEEETPLATNVGTGSQTSVNTKGEKETFSAKNQLIFFNVLSISSGYTKNRNSTIKTGSNNTTEGEIFPSLSTGLQRLERFMPFKWIFSSATARVGYERKKDESFTNDVRQSETISRAFSPLVSIQGTMKSGFTSNFVYETGEADARQFVNRQKSHKDASSIRVTSSYSFSSPNGIPLPILRGLRLRSTMSLSVSISYKTDQTFTGSDSVATANLPLTSQSSVLSITPQATYSFSLRMKGGMTAEWTDRSDRSPTSGRRKTHVRSLGIWAEFTF